MFQEAKLWALSQKDIIHGFIMAFGAATLTGLIDLLSNGGSITQEMVLFHCKAGLIAGLVYVLKKFSSNSKGEIGKKD